MNHSFVKIRYIGALFRQLYRCGVIYDIIDIIETIKGNTCFTVFCSVSSSS
ncbi:hypothetical protein [Clostridium sp. SM-530-WT-3G]|uniref:hypothetical protein n=1 Tax=Clostridium sp. SM-530-WT-3G TaxID=2725303 RepID=UPI00145D08FA|nr:hypothetical protein [Clostridium sp. SM-530-WT-3G]NME84185.1 hypothetical protein [Clostridium sp. SM-530-WT-3G]